MDADGVIEDVGCLAKDVIFEMCIANNAADDIVQLQVFAYFGDRFDGIIRFCPIPGPGVQEPPSVREFENKCVLPPRFWLGPPDFSQ